MQPREDRIAVRRAFVRAMVDGLRVVSPILSVLLLAIATLGLIAGLIEGWPVADSIYFAFVSGLTIGYGDLAPKTVMARALAILIGFCGVLLTGLVAAVAVKAFTTRHEYKDDNDDV
jgi:Ion channel